MQPLHHKKRPLSPHLQIYKPQLTSIMSILHRLTGMALSLGAFIFVGWLYYLTQGDQGYIYLNTIAATPLAHLALLFWIFALFYHLFNGIRHLFRDLGKGFELKEAYTSGYAVIILSLVFTAIFYGEVLF
ncbi:MAG: succinate dehydrogenase, cytochrome b556 subunit [Alphaproteobacteria bacterium]|nr:succinate dehydrogenase, cytochrome b556 subunit [Alphaproteobacteria bacterium]